MATEYEITARWEKSTTLAAHLYVNGILSVDVHRIEHSIWIGLAAAAGVHPPSDDRTKLVIQFILRKLETAVAQKIAEQQKEQNVT